MATGAGKKEGTDGQLSHKSGKHVGKRLKGQSSTLGSTRDAIRERPWLFAADPRKR